MIKEKLEILLMLYKDDIERKNDEEFYNNRIEVTLAAIKSELIEKLPKKRDVFGAAIDPFKRDNLGFNDCLEKIKQIIAEA